MKKIAVILLILPELVFSQTSGNHNFPDIIEKEKLNNAKLISEITPGYWATEEYNKNMDYISSEIKTHKVKPLKRKGRIVFIKYWWYKTKVANGVLKYCLN